MEISVVIPVYNTVQNLLVSLPKLIEQFKSKYNTFEIILIIDNTNKVDKLEELYLFQKEVPEISIHYLNNNYGQHFATLCGYYFAKGEHILSVDEDMSDKINEVIYNNTFKDYDLFYFLYDKNNMYSTGFRKICSAFFRKILDAAFNMRKHSTFRIISASLKEKLLAEKHIYWSLDIMSHRQTTKIGYTTLRTDDITDKGTSYNLFRLLNMIYEIGMEYYTFTTSIALLFLPFCLLYCFSKNMVMTLVVHILSAMTMTVIFKFRRCQTNVTLEKILKAALSQQVCKLKS